MFIPMTFWASAPVAGPADYASEVIADSPVAWYRFYDAGELSGSALSDSANGNTFDITATDAVLNINSGGPTGGSYGEWITNGSDSPLGIALSGMEGASVSATGFSIEFWILENLSGPIVPVGDNGASDEILHSNSSYDGSTLDVGHNWFGDDMTTGPLSVSSGWHHIVLTWDSGTNTRYIYVDGAEVTSGTPGGSPAWSNSTRVLSETSVNIAEIAFYAHTLSASRVLAHFNAA
jgi:hypothetical protein